MDIAPAKRAKPTPPLLIPIKYTRPRAGRPRCGAAAGKEGLALLPCTFTQQHGSITCDFDPAELGNEMEAVPCEVRDARELDPAPTLATHGYELWRAPRPETALTPLLPSEANGPGAALELHYKETAAALCELMGASDAVSYCHVRRSATQAVQQSSAGGPYGQYAHTDMAADSWSGLLPELADAWEDRGPPGVPSDFARRCARARRYAVVTAWRYLGPAEACRHSHLAVVDPRSVAPADVLPFDIAAFGHVGRNYRLVLPSAPGAAREERRAHAWWYWPALKPSSELVLFTVFDSAHPAAVVHGPDTGADAGEAVAPFAALPATSIFHSAFADPSAPADEPERESIDTRVLVVWD